MSLFSSRRRGIEPGELGLEYVAWREMVLAPLLSIAAVRGLDDREAVEARRLALWHGLLNRQGERNTTRGEDYQLWSKLSRPGERARLERALQAKLKEMDEPDRVTVAERIWDACREFASAFYEHGVGVSDEERGELARVASLLALPDDMERRAVLGTEAQALVSEVAPRAEPGAAPVPRPKWESGLDPGTKWAAGWNEPLAERAWSDMNAMHEAHEALWKAGKGRLDGVTHLDEVAFEAKPYCDAGVLVAPRSILEREIYFVGDLHGDLGSLERALAAMRFFEFAPEDTAGPVAVFLGDYGDRGIDTLAVWMRIAWLKRTFPDRIILIRGNHEELIEVNCSLADTGTELGKSWHVPMTLNRESYLALGFILSGNFENVAMVYDYFPGIVLFPDGLMAAHGGVLPRWKKDDGWPAGVAAKDPLRVSGIRDLRKPTVQLYMRWVAPRNATDFSMSWAGFGTHYRHESSAADFDAFCEVTGVTHMIHGHTHPPDGFDAKCEGRVVGVNTSIHTGRTPAIAHYLEGPKEFEIIEVGGE